MRILLTNVQALIFDLDGVLVDSRAAVDVAWQAWADELHIPFDIVAATIPGRRTRDAVHELAPHLDAVEQAARIVAHEQRLAHHVTAIRGAAELLAQLPHNRWAIATSGTESVARPRLQYAGLPEPAILITAEMVARGKPDPQGYLLAATALGFDPGQCTVFEDAPDGISAARSAGCCAVGVLTWATSRQLAAPVAVHDLRAVEATATATHISLRIESIE